VGIQAVIIQPQAECPNPNLPPKGRLKRKFNKLKRAGCFWERFTALKSSLHITQKNA